MNAAAPDDDRIVDQMALGQRIHYRARRVRTPDGLTVAVQDWAPDSVPRRADVLFLHGFSQAHGAWLHQVTAPMAGDFRLITYDLRGHGDSDQPDDARYYRDPGAWAGEVKSVIDALQLRRPVLVAWSYAGRVALDYLGAFGDAALGGLVMLNAASSSAMGMMGPAVGLLRQMTSPDAAAAREGTQALLRACAVRTLGDAETDYMMEYNMRVPAVIRSHLVGRPADYDATLRAVRVPTWVVQGDRDPVTAPAMSAHTQRLVPGAVLTTYEGVGHMPFWETSMRFNEDLADFIQHRVL